MEHLSTVDDFEEINNPNKIHNHAGALVSEAVFMPRILAAVPETSAHIEDLSLENAAFRATMEYSKSFGLLTATEEKQLAVWYKEGAGAARRLFANEYTDETARIQDEALQTKGELARQRFWVCNLRLVGNEAIYSYETHPRGQKYGLMDLFQQGCIGLNRAIEKFDPGLGYRFSTYGTLWIRQSLGRALDSTQDIHVPYRVRQQMDLAYRLERDGASDEEIMETMGCDQDQLLELRVGRRDTHYVHSLEEPTQGSARKPDSDKMTLGEVFTDPKALVAYELEDGLQLSDNTLAMLAVLEPLLADADVALLRSLQQTENGLTITERRHMLRLNSLFEHPAVRAALQPFAPVGKKFEADWRDDANCIGYPEVFTKAKPSTKSQAIKICGGCAVRSQCRQYFLVKKPEKGRWSGVHTMSMRAKHGRKKRATQAA